MLVSSSLLILFLSFFLILLLKVDLMALVDQLLLALNIFEHVFGLRNAHIVGEHFRVVFIEFKYTR